MTRFLKIVAFCVALTFVSSSHAGIGDTYNLSPFWKWKQIETEHFRIAFPAELADTAERAANFLEEANAVLSKKLYWQTPSKTQILLIDNADSANGVTSAIGRFGIVLYVTPPDNWFSTAYYDDWLRLLCFHEYTHLLNMDATRGFWQTGRYLFGDTLLPNAIWPSWMLEGLAVYDETRYTRAGRGRSPYYDMILRTAVDAGVLDTDRFFTLDRINSTRVPYFPGGEAYYLFGYELMNEVAKSAKAGPTADGEGKLTSGEDALGVMSYRSSDRFPWFINGNLKNITGKDWYDYWYQFVREARERAARGLAVIRSQPLSPVRNLTTNGYNVTGSAFSQDGNWVAYTGETLDERNCLVLRNLKTGESNCVADKIAGAQVSFTPDSKFVILSSLRQEDQYFEYSELGAYSLEKKKVDWLTSKRRARDPSLSRDGKTVVFTVTRDARTSLAQASVTLRDGKIELSEFRQVVSVSKYDVISSPKFSPDGRTVFFSIHRNGKTSEELMSLDLASRHLRTLVANGHFNRFPAVNSRGEVFFVSDLTGVDNVYKYREGSKPELYSNLTTGIWFPSVSQDDHLYGAILSYSGWNLAEIDSLPKEVTPESVTIAHIPEPVSDSDSEPRVETRQYPVEDYSVIPSIWPRGWIPYAYLAPNNVSFGEVIAGFDAVDRHRYLLNIGYDTLSSSVDWLAEYQNRSFGPTLTFVAENQFSYATYFGENVDYYVRDQAYSFGVSFDKVWTYSSLTPSLSLTFDRTSYYFPNVGHPAFQTAYLPDLDAVLSFNNTLASRLAIAPERGREFMIGGRYYINNGTPSSAVKGVVADTEFIRLGSSHAVLAPSFKASYTTANPSSNTNQNSDVIVQGYFPLFFSSPFALGVNGYKRLIDRQYTRTPFYESRRMAVWLSNQGFDVNRKWILRLMRIMGLEAIRSPDVRTL